MPRPIWPPEFPGIPLRGDYSRGVANNIMRSAPDAGPSKIRLSAGRKPATETVSLLFRSSEQYRAFENWFHDKKSGLAGGAMCFEWKDVMTGKAVVARLAPRSDDAFFSVSPYEKTIDVWTVTLTLEIMP